MTNTLVLREVLPTEQRIITERIDRWLCRFNRELNAMLWGVITSGYTYKALPAHAFSTLGHIYKDLDTAYLLAQKLENEEFKKHYLYKVTSMMHNVVNIRHLF